MDEQKFEYVDNFCRPRKNDKRVVANGITCVVDIFGGELLPHRVHELNWTCPACGTGHHLHVKDMVPAEVPCPYCGATYCVVAEFVAHCDVYRSRADYEEYRSEMKAPF